MPICCFVVPMILPYYFMGTSLKVCFFTCSMMRYCMSLHGTWLVNSAAHFYGMKPYDLTISPVNSRIVSNITFGEGWHNYHHVFPWDYKAAELGNYNGNWTTAFIDLMARLGKHTRRMKEREWRRRSLTQSFPYCRSSLRSEVRVAGDGLQACVAHWRWIASGLPPGCEQQ